MKRANAELCGVAGYIESMAHERKRHGPPLPSLLLLLFLLLLAVALLEGCYLFDNPVDPEADNYQGFTSDRPTTAPDAPALLVPTGIGLSDREHQVRLTWLDLSDNEEGFRVERKIGAGSYAPVATLAPGTMLYVDTSLSGDTTYTLRVLAYNVVGSSASNEPSWTTAPRAPDGLFVASSGASDITLQWNDNSTTRDGYSVEHCTDGVSWAEVATVTAAPFTTYHHTGLPAGPHYYRVRAYGAAGESNYSNEVSHTL
jgi:hypothetical protein